MYRTLSDFVIGETNTDKQLAASTGIAESHDYLIGLVSVLFGYSFTRQTASLTCSGCHGDIEVNDIERHRSWLNEAKMRAWSHAFV